MNCNSGQRKQFADDLVASVSEVLKQYGLDEVVVHREADPVLVAARGCLKPRDEGQDDEPVQMVLRISPDFDRAEQRSLEGSEVIETAAQDVYRAFDLSEVVAADTVAKGEAPKQGSC